MSTRDPNQSHISTPKPPLLPQPHNTKEKPVGPTKFWFNREPLFKEGTELACIKMKILYPYKLTGLIIGKGGCQINKLKEKYGCHINLPKQRNGSLDRPMKIIFLGWSRRCGNRLKNRHL